MGDAIDSDDVNILELLLIDICIREGVAVVLPVSSILVFLPGSSETGDGALLFLPVSFGNDISLGIYVYIVDTGFQYVQFGSGRKGAGGCTHLVVSK